MHTMTVLDVNEALPRALAYLRDSGDPTPSRNGSVLVARSPVATTYLAPRRRVLFDAERDANPFFHLFESLWILAGREDVRTLAWFNSRIADYSDDGEVFHAPYGRRLRVVWGDQVSVACDMLRADPYDRRAVLQIWSPLLDLGWGKSKDLPCNDIIMLRVLDDASMFHPSKKRLDITVCCRSNDAIWGAYGANAVQFSMLQEYMAHKIGVGVGRYTQMSHNLHVYTQNDYWRAWVSRHPWGVYVPDCQYGLDEAQVTPLIAEDELVQDFDMDNLDLFRIADRAKSLEDFGKAIAVDFVFRTRFFSEVVVPMLYAYSKRKEEYPYRLPAQDHDWLVAGTAWLERRWAKKEQQK